MVHFGFLFLAFVGGFLAGCYVVYWMVKIAARTYRAIDAGARVWRL